jgi:hypothetical protein
MYDFCKNACQNHINFTTDFYTYGNSASCKKKHQALYGAQDATLRGAKDDLNLKENKTNTSRKKLKTLTEESNQQPVKREKKRRRNNKTTTAKTTKSHRECSLQT